MSDYFCLTNGIIDGCHHNISYYEMPDLMDVIVHDDDMMKHLLDVGNRTLVLFDLDKTVIYSALHQVANDDCFGPIINHHEQFLEKEEARDKTLQIHNLMSSHSNFVLVAPDVADAFTYLSSLGVDFMGLTARDAPIAKATLKQLQEVGLQFSAVHHSDFDLECRPNGRFEGQVIFADAGHKGQCLAEFLQKINYNKPDKIIFFDDKEKNLRHVAETCKELRINFYGVRYSALDGWSTQITEEVCYEQNNYFIRELINSLHMEDKCRQLHAYFMNNALAENHHVCHAVMHDLLSSFII